MAVDARVEALNEVDHPFLEKKLVFVLHLHHLLLRVNAVADGFVLAGSIMAFLSAEAFYSFGERFANPAPLHVLVELHFLAFVWHAANIMINNYIAINRKTSILVNGLKVRHSHTPNNTTLIPFPLFIFINLAEISKNDYLRLTAKFQGREGMFTAGLERSPQSFLECGSASDKFYMLIDNIN